MIDRVSLIDVLYLNQSINKPCNQMYYYITAQNALAKIKYIVSVMHDYIILGLYNFKHLNKYANHLYVIISKPLRKHITSWMSLHWVAQEKSEGKVIEQADCTVRSLLSVGCSLCQKIALWRGRCFADCILLGAFHRLSQAKWMLLKVESDKRWNKDHYLAKVAEHPGSPISWNEGVSPF